MGKGKGSKSVKLRKISNSRRLNGDSIRTAEIPPFPPLFDRPMANPYCLTVWWTYVRIKPDFPPTVAWEYDSVLRNTELQLSSSVQSDDDIPAEGSVDEDSPIGQRSFQRPQLSPSTPYFYGLPQRSKHLAFTLSGKTPLPPTHPTISFFW